MLNLISLAGQVSRLGPSRGYGRARKVEFWVSIDDGEATLEIRCLVYGDKASGLQWKLIPGDWILMEASLYNREIWGTPVLVIREWLCKGPRWSFEKARRDRGKRLMRERADEL